MLSLSELKEGMVLAKDVMINDGTLLMPDRTSLTANHIIKLSVYNVPGVAVFVEEAHTAHAIIDPYVTIEQEIERLDTTAELEASITGSPEFMAFQKTYIKHLSIVESQLNTIVRTGGVDLGPLYEVANDALNSTASSADFFSFLCRMRSSDDVTYSHCLNVGMLASILGKWLNLPVHTTTELAIAGLLHDIGKVKVNQTILNKAGKLTEEEFAHIKEHTTLGYKIVSETTLPIGIKHAILMHHEKLNGGGYPLGLSLERIHDYAKIISIVDIYDAMTAERPYHRRFHPFHVIRMFEDECYGILDNKILDVFLERIAHNFMEDNVKLSDGTTGKIIFIHHRNPSRPIIQLDSGKIVDLLNEDEIRITQFI